MTTMARLTPSLPHRHLGAPWSGRIPAEETVLWQGMRMGSVLHNKARGPALLLAIAVLWTAFFATARRDLEVPVVFGLLALVWLVGQIIAIRRNPHAERYLLTDRAAYIATGPATNAKLSRFSLFVDDAAGRLDEADPSSVQIGTRQRRPQTLRLDDTPVHDAVPAYFHDITDAEKVSDLIRQIRAGHSQ
ncbi:hypothetical protein [Thioclava sp. GXIMD4216]|uniref:PH domain-containing protein n=1 Tax=Thioclava litoralis TaxID=3076557 RepID=A0ABZ1E459_9RHOB|nr:hypothetical protein RPE78_04545 [Thioclava sp. FTW29]